DEIAAGRRRGNRCREGGRGRKGRWGRRGRKGRIGGKGRTVPTFQPPPAPPALSALVHRDDVDLDARVPGQPRDLDRRSRRIRLVEEPAVHFVHRREVVHVGKE